MPEFAPTKDQRAAIEKRGSSILVSAGAGSGKTKVLTERLMRRMQDEEKPVDLDRFLVITYTRAAAGELRSRITQSLGEALARDPGNRRLRKQSALVPRAQIGTIHSFCTAFLREFAHMAGIGPDFGVLDEQRAAGMKATALERVLEEHYANADKYPGFLLLADTVGAGRDDRKLGELVLNLHSKMQSHARPGDWSERQRDILWEKAEDLSQTAWGKELMKNAAETVDYWVEEMEKVLSVIRSEPAIAKAWLEGYAQSTDEMRELRRCLELSWERSRACFPISFGGGVLRKSPDKTLSDALKARRDACRRAMEKLAESFALPQEEMLADQQRSAPAMEALLELVNAFDDSFKAAKRRANLLDFSDLEHLCAQILIGEDGSPTELALQVRDRWEEILVDEFQDVNRVQDDLFNAISRDGKNLFMVGDVKQSIYRFRLADPTIFIEKYEKARLWEEAEQGEDMRILLRENFRSRREILDGANAVFSRCMSRSLGEVDYNEEAALLYGARDYVGSVPKPELLLLRLEQGDGDEDAPDKVALEAAMVGEQIRQLMREGTTVQGKEGPRPLEYGDIAVLLRATKDPGPIFRRVLTGMGIPVGFGQGDGFFQAEEISAVISLLAVLDNPHQDIPLIGVLRFPALGFDANELSAIRASAPEGDFFTALRAWSEKNEKGRRFLALLERLRRAAPDLRAADLIDLILEELDMLAVCSAMRDGEQRRARLMELSDLSERFEKTGYRGLHRFVLWLRRMAEKGQALLENYFNDYTLISETDLDRQVRNADARLGRYGFPNIYGGRYYNDEDPNAHKIDCILFAADDSCRTALGEYAKKKLHEFAGKYRLKIVSKSDSCKKKYHDILADSDIVSEQIFAIPENITVREDPDGIEYDNHLLASETTGLAKIKLGSSWEPALIEEESHRSDFVCWLRNPARAPWALCLPYTIAGEKKSFYPDFLIIRSDPDLDYVVDILEPHGDQFADNLPKAKALAEYAKKEDRIGRIQLIHKNTGVGGVSQFRRLDLTDLAVRDKVLRANNDDELKNIFYTNGI